MIIFTILYRIFSATFSRYESLRRWTFVLYMAALAACLVLAIVVAPASVRARGVVHIVVPLWQTSMIFRAGILAFLFLVVFGIGIPMRDYLFGIAAGLGLNAVITLVTALVKVPRLWWISYGQSFADFVAASIWLVYLFVPRETTNFSAVLVDGDELARWKQALSEFLHK